MHIADRLDPVAIRACRLARVPTALDVFSNILSLFTQFRGCPMISKTLLGNGWILNGHQLRWLMDSKYPYPFKTLRSWPLRVPRCALF
jgi:hypothetical protein